MSVRVVPERPLRAVDYQRVSMVGSREEIISPETQGSANHDRAAADGWEIVATLSDIDRTGRNFTRSGIQEAIAGVEDGRWEVVLVYRYDRFGRNVRDSLVNIARIEAAGGQVVSDTEPFDSSTAVGKYGRTNLLAVAELQSDIIGENWKAAHARRRAQGLPHGGQRRLGYRKAGKRYEPDPDWAPVAAEAYRRYIEGQGLRVIAQWLNSLGAPTRNRGSHGWGHNSVAHMLDTGFAAGLLRESGTHVEGAHEAIIDTETWQAYQRARRERSRTPKRLLAPRSPLSGVVLCAHCRRRMIVRGDARYGPHYLVLCDKDDCAGRPYLLASRVDDAILDQLRLLADDVDARAEAKVKARAHRAEVRVERRLLQRRAADLDRALLRASRQVAEGLIPEGVYRQMRDELVADQAAVEEQLAATAPPPQPPSRIKVRGLLRDWPGLPVATRRDITRTLFGVKVRRTEHGCQVVAWPAWEDEPE